MSDPEIKWRHFIEPVPKFLKQQPNQGGDSNVAFFKYVDTNPNSSQKSTKKKYSFIMSKTSIALVVGLLLLLSLLFFMAGYFVSKDVYKDPKNHFGEDAPHKIESSEYGPPKELSKTAEDVKALESVGEGILVSAASPLVNEELKAGNKAVQGALEKGKAAGNAAVSRAQDYYHRLVGVSGAETPKDPASSAKTPTPSQVKPVHQAEQARLWPKVPGSDEMFEVRPASDVVREPSQAKPTTIYNYDVDNYLPNQVGNRTDPNAETRWDTAPSYDKSSEYAAQFLDNSATPVFTNEQANEMAHVGKYMVQVGAFQKADNAQQLVGRLEQNGTEANVYQGWDANQRPWYFVRLGQHETIDKANKHALKVTEQGSVYGNDNPTPYAIVVKGTTAEKLVKSND